VKIMTVVGARPQFIKAAAVSREIAKRPEMKEIIIHTGQHYDESMSRIFFEELAIPVPDYHLGIGSGTHGAQTGAMLEKIEAVLLDEKPDWVLVYGDTNSTLAGTLAAVKLHIPIAHVEAGLRSFNRAMPEEINRIIADKLSSILFCPSQTAVNNLAHEGITQGVHLVGDVMYEALLFAAEQADRRSNILETLRLEKKNYLLVTVHRAENTDNRERLSNIMQALECLAKRETVVFPIHPRTQKALEQMGYDFNNSEFRIQNLKFTDPIGYLDMIILEQSARVILTDSGGVQKEAYWLSVPCVTLRDETEWVETVETGWNRLAGTEPDRIIQAVNASVSLSYHPSLYSDGQVSHHCSCILLEHEWKKGEKIHGISSHGCDEKHFRKLIS
jgi:UDP-GlcNAc3NAcA epimerase